MQVWIETIIKECVWQFLCFQEDRLGRNDDVRGSDERDSWSDGASVSELFNTWMLILIGVVGVWQSPRLLKLIKHNNFIMVALR